jgi:hypothetical protein
MRGFMTQAVTSAALRCGGIGHQMSKPAILTEKPPYSQQQPAFRQVTITLQMLKHWPPISHGKRWVLCGLPKKTGVSGTRP